jgi:3-isopropylmalate dehydrogenase
MAMVLSAAMMLRLGLQQVAAAEDLEAAVDRVLAAGARTGDLASDPSTALGCRAMGDLLLEALAANET